MLGFTYNFNEDAVRERGFAGDYMIRNDKTIYGTDQTTIFIDAMYKHNGFSFMGEYAKRTADDEVAKDENGDIIFDNDGDPKYIVLTGNALLAFTRVGNAESSHVPSVPSRSSHVATRSPIPWVAGASLFPTAL